MEGLNQFLENKEIFAGFMCYWSLFFYLSKQLTFRNQWMKPEVRSLLQSIIVSITHGVVVVMASGYWILTEPASRISAQTSNYQTIVCLHSVSYLIVHVVAMKMFGILDKKLITHHFFSVLAIIYPILSNYGGYICLKGLLYADITNLSMNSRIIIKEQKLRYTKIYQLLDTYYLVMYIIFRIILSPFHIFYPSLVSQNVPIGMTIMFFAILIQSISFAPTMFSILKNKAQVYRAFWKETQQNQLWWFQVNPKAEEIMAAYCHQGKAIF